MPGHKHFLDVLIPARGGSQEVPRKNVLDFNNRPLISWTISNAINAKCVRRVFVSTDCDEIAEISESYGATIINRPEVFATDTSPTEEAIQHFFTCDIASDIENLCLLQCTSPIREVSFLDRFLELHTAGNFDSSLTVVKTHRFFWKMSNSGGAVPQNYQPKSRPRRQDILASDQLYEETGSGYIFSKSGFLRHNSRLFGNIGLFETSWAENFEIDTEEDFKIVQKIQQISSL